MVRGHKISKGNPIACIPATSFTGPRYLHYLTPLQAIVASHRITELYARKLCVFETTVGDGKAPWVSDAEWWSVFQNKRTIFEVTVFSLPV